MPDNNENTNIIHVIAIDGLCEQISKELKDIAPENENQNYERNEAWKGLIFWRRHHLYKLQKSIERKENENTTERQTKGKESG